MMTNPSYPLLDGEALAQAARHLLGFYGKPGGYQPGTFTTLLIRAWEHADSSNNYKLSIIYPEMGVIVNLMKRGDEASVLSIAEWTP